jgi:hypothetical protein
LTAAGPLDAIRASQIDLENRAMPFAIYPALFFTVVLLVTTAYFLMGGLPLLILQHDTPLDARFIRSFFAIYYKGVFFAAVGASVSYALWGRFAFAIGAAAMALMAVALRKRLIPAMERIGAQIQEDGASAITRFRKIHSVALLANLTQLVVIVWGLIRISV